MPAQAQAKLAGMRAAIVDFGSCARPTYPKDALRHERTGTVDLRFLVAADGKVKEAKVTSSSGHADLDEAALSALEKCLFKPGTVDGQAQESWTNVKYVWTLEPAATSKAISNATTLPPGTTAAKVDFNTCDRPIYPKDALRHERTGVVRLNFTIGVDGSVKNADVRRSSGHTDLDEAALTALSKCRFKPGMKDGQPIESTTNVQYVWTLESGTADRQAKINFQTCTMPTYPAKALAEKRSGTVILKFLVDEDGRAENNELVRTSGSPDLDRVATDAFDKCRFIPAVKAGKPVKDSATVYYTWTLPPQ
jgi:TonB family protein